MHSCKMCGGVIDKVDTYMYEWLLVEIVKRPLVWILFCIIVKSLESDELDQV